MKQRQDIIPFDDLHWSEEDGVWRTISDEELVKLISVCQQSGRVDTSSSLFLVRWAEETRVRAILLRMLLDNQLEIEWGEDDEEFRFSKKET
jgi:hypothetical protein